MVTHRFAGFLEDPAQYAHAVHYWAHLWDRIDPIQRSVRGWRQPWFSTTLANGTSELDGNPIFSAFSPSLRRGIRIIQYPPTAGSVEFDCWQDTFGGTRSDPEAIWELVISCALSDEAADRAFGAISEWVAGRPVRITFTQFRQLRDGVTEDSAALPIYVGEPGIQVVTV